MKQRIDSDTKNRNKVRDNVVTERPIVAIVIVGAALLGFVWWRSFDIHDIPTKYLFMAQASLNILLLALVALQANISNRQWSAMEAQSKLMNESLTETRNAVAASRNQIKLVIEKERARIHVEVMKISPPPPNGANLPQLPPMPWDCIECRIFNHGPTAANIKSAKATVLEGLVADQIEIPNETNLTVEPFFRPNETGVVVRACAHARFLWDDIDAGRRTIRISGCIEYLDLFSDDIRETTFQYRWYVHERAISPDTGRHFAMWMKDGEEKDNHQT